MKELKDYCLIKTDITLAMKINWKGGGHQMRRTGRAGDEVLRKSDL